MKKTTTLFCTALVAALCSFPGQAEKVYYVDPDGNAPEGMTVDAVYTKVAAAINAVTADEPVTIYLKPGYVFKESNMTTGTNRVDLTIIGDSSIINAGAAQRILRTEAARLVLKDITFTGVKNYTSMGGVLYFAGNANSASELVIDSCVFENCALTSGADGGAAIATGTNAMNVTITNSVFRNNQTEGYRDAMSGTSIHFQGKEGVFTVENSIFQNNVINSNSGAMAVGIVNNSNVQARLANNTFYNNTTKGVPVGSVPNILIKGSGNSVQVVNNTFYFDLREESDDEGDQTLMKDVYRRTSAVNISETGNNTLYFVNNAVVGLRNAVISPAATGRTIACQNNYAVVLEPHSYVSELADNENGNMLITARESNVGDPFIADIEALTSLMTEAGLSDTLATDNFVPYLAVSETSPLVNAGIAEYLVGEENIVPLVDVLGTAREDDGVDIGAYEYVPSDQPTAIAGVDAATDLRVYVQSGNLVVENHTDTAFQVTLFQIDGRQVAAMPVQQTAVIGGDRLPRGVLLVVATNGHNQIVKKVIL